MVGFLLRQVKQALNSFAYCHGCSRPCWSAKALVDRALASWIKSQTALPFV